VQLVILGYAFGGIIKHLKVGVVDQDHGLQAVKLREMFGAIAANARTFETVGYTAPHRALRDLRNGRITGVPNIPPNFSRQLLGGGIIFIDDNARGLHEGYLVTPITKFELILGFNLAGTVKAILAGLVLTTGGSLIAGIPHPFEPVRFARLLLAIVATSLALI